MRVCSGSVACRHGRAHSVGGYALQVSLYQSKSERDKVANTIPYAAAQLMEYISYARAHCVPSISDEVRVAYRWRALLFVEGLP